MSEGQILAYGLLGLALVWYLRRLLRLRAVRQHSPAEAAVLVRQKDGALLLDVRTARERERSSIKGSIHIPLHELRRRSEELARHKGREIICFCQTGSRSLSAAVLLRQLGYSASNMRGGMAEWNLTEPR
ncbi:MAG: rhodanese-like domain-containing protein [Bacteroidota bacterium]